MDFGALAQAAHVNRRPVIGVTGPDRGGLAAWWFTALAVRRAGGRPVRIRPGSPKPINGLDGLIVGGGADVSPRLYGQPQRPRPRRAGNGAGAPWRRLAGLVVFPLTFVLRRVLTTRLGGPAPARDRLERGLIEAALARHLPVMGICRGMQLLNVTLGGSLHQHLEGFYVEYPAVRSVLPRKRVGVKPDTRVGASVGTGPVRVNALHSQAIDRLAAGLVVAAIEDNGIIQAIELDEADWVVGVQWHPEYLPQRRRQQALFASLVEAARTHSCNAH